LNHFSKIKEAILLTISYSLNNENHGYKIKVTKAEELGNNI